jgi:hypothetical protein
MQMLGRGFMGLMRQAFVGKGQSMLNSASSMLTEKRLQNETDLQNALAAAKTRMTYERSVYKYASNLADEFSRMV